jgi:peptide-methionine (S)-S-oxide reductase
MDDDRAGLTRSTIMTATERAVLAGGCFWGMQDLIRRRPGVISTRVGYTGDEATPNATYRRHGDHAEAIEIIFDPTRTASGTSWNVFFQIHDPTTWTGRATTAVAATGRRSSSPATSSGAWRRTPSPTSRPRALARQGVTEVDRRRRSGRPSRAPGLPGADSQRYTCHFPRPGWKLPHRAPAGDAA